MLAVVFGSDPHGAACYGWRTCPLNSYGRKRIVRSFGAGRKLPCSWR